MKESFLIAPWAALPFIVLAVTARIIRRSWLAPGAFFALYWCLAVLAPLIFLPHDKVSVGTICWIFVSSLAVVAGDLVGVITRPKKGEVKPNLTISALQASFMCAAIICCTLMGLLAVVIVLGSAVQSLGGLLSLQNLLAAARELADNRHTGDYTPFLVQLLRIFIYAGPLFSGLLIAIQPSSRHLIIAVLSMLPPLIMTALFTLRGFIILSILLFISSYLATRLLFGQRRLFSRGHLITGSLIAVLLFVIAVGVHLGRKGSIDIGSTDAYVDAQTCAFGHLAVFSDWFERPHKVENPLPGAFTFAGIFDLIGIRDRYVGLYAESVTLSSGDRSNVYTAFRGLILDFTPCGSIVILFLFALVAGRVYEQLLGARSAKMPILAAFYASVLWSFCTSIWIFNSIIGAFLLFATGYLIMLHLDIVKSLGGSLYSRFKK